MRCLTTCSARPVGVVPVHVACPAALCLAALCLAAAPAAEPLRLHPDNPHYFLFRGKPTVLVSSGEHYGAVLNLDFDTILAGGGLYNNLDYSFTCRAPNGRFLDYQSPGGGSPALRGQLKILREFIEGFDVVRMAPANGVVRRGVPAEGSVRVLAQPAKAYAIYLHERVGPARKAATGSGDATGSVAAACAAGESHTELVLELPAGRYRAEWLNTKTAAVDKSDDFEHAGGEKTISSPGYSEDIALRIRAVP